MLLPNQLILGFLWMSEKELGFDITMQGTDGRQYIEIQLNGRPKCMYHRSMRRSWDNVARGLYSMVRDEPPEADLEHRPDC